jgi:hypothetical protein
MGLIGVSKSINNLQIFGHPHRSQRSLNPDQFGHGSLWMAC